MRSYRKLFWGKSFPHSPGSQSCLWERFPREHALGFGTTTASSPFVQTLRCSCEIIKGQVDEWRCRCEVPLNKDTYRERGRGREATAAVELLLVHITHTKSICAEVAPIAFWVVSASTKFSTTRCSCPHHQLVELTVALAVGPLAWAMPAEVVCIVWRFSLSTCCCCNSAVLWRLA